MSLVAVRNDSFKQIKHFIYTRCAICVCRLLKPANTYPLTLTIASRLLPLSLREKGSLTLSASPETGIEMRGLSKIQISGNNDSRLLAFDAYLSSAMSARESRKKKWLKWISVFKRQFFFVGGLRELCTEIFCTACYVTWHHSYEQAACPATGETTLSLTVIN